MGNPEPEPIQTEEERVAALKERIRLGKLEKRRAKYGVEPTLIVARDANGRELGFRNGVPTEVMGMTLTRGQKRQMKKNVGRVKLKKGRIIKYGG